MERAYTLEEAARVMGTTRSFALELVAQRRIRFVEDGSLVFIPESAIDELLYGDVGESERRQS